jgi:hypothetical protein
VKGVQLGEWVTCLHLVNIVKDPECGTAICK